MVYAAYPVIHFARWAFDRDFRANTQWRLQHAAYSCDREEAVLIWARITK